MWTRSTSELRSSQLWKTCTLEELARQVVPGLYAMWDNCGQGSLCFHIQMLRVITEGNPFVFLAVSNVWQRHYLLLQSSHFEGRRCLANLFYLVGKGSRPG